MTQEAKDQPGSQPTPPEERLWSLYKQIPDISVADYLL